MPDMQYPGPGSPVRLVDDVGGALLTTDGKLSVAVDGITFEGDVSFDDTGIIAAVDAGTVATGDVETAVGLTTTAVAAVQTATEDVELSVDEAKAAIVTAVEDVELSVDEAKAAIVTAVEDVELSVDEAKASIILTTTAVDQNKAEVIRVGTRAYDYANGQRVTVSGTSAATASSITATEVLLHASTKCYVRSASTPTAVNTDIPLEAGEKFHMRITSGHKVAAIQDAAGGVLSVIPVA